MDRLIIKKIDMTPKTKENFINSLKKSKIFHYWPADLRKLLNCSVEKVKVDALLSALAR